MVTHVKRGLDAVLCDVLLRFPRPGDRVGVVLQDEVALVGGDANEFAVLGPVKEKHFRRDEVISFSGTQGNFLG